MVLCTFLGRFYENHFSNYIKNVERDKAEIHPCYSAQELSNEQSFRWSHASLGEERYQWILFKYRIYIIYIYKYKNSNIETLLIFILIMVYYLKLFPESFVASRTFEPNDSTGNIDTRRLCSRFTMMMANQTLHDGVVWLNLRVQMTWASIMNHGAMLWRLPRTRIRSSRVCAKKNHLDQAMFTRDVSWADFFFHTIYEEYSYIRSVWNHT